MNEVGVNLPEPVRGWRPGRFAVLASFNAVFIISQFYRSAVAVIAPDLAVELSLGPAELGAVAGAFFVAIAIMQIPVGVLLDRFGPRYTAPSLLVLAVLGAILFARADNMLGLIMGQALIGAGCAGVFMGGLVAVARWFPPRRFAVVSSVMLSISICGLLLSATPLAWAAQWIGWRGAFLGVAALTALFALVVFAVVRDAPPHHDYHSRAPQSLREVARGLAEVVRNRNLPYLLALAFVAYAAVFVVRGLWGGPYLADVHHLDGVARGNVLFVMSLGTMVGILCYGPLEGYLGARKMLVLTGAGASAAVLTVLALVPSLPLPWVTVLFVLLGAAGAYVVLLLAHGRALFPDHLVGRAVTTVNFANFVGAGVMQIITGLLIDMFEEVDGRPPETAYRTVFGVMAAIIIAAAALYSRAHDPGHD